MNAQSQAGEIFAQLAQVLETGKMGDPVTVVLTTLGSELGVEELVRGAEMAEAQNPGLRVILVGPPAKTDLQVIESQCQEESHGIMEELLASGQADAAVTLHYNFPLGVSTVGRVMTPARGKPVFLATTTGATAPDRVAAMVLNAIGGVAVAKSMGISRPKLGILNVEGARQVERVLRALAQRGYPLEFSQSVRSDGGSVLRGNDLLTGNADVVVCDTLTGNLLMKMFSAFTSGGTYETVGWGYGPGVGEGFDKVVNIISRASGAPVVANAIQYAAGCSQGYVPKRAAAEYQAAWQAGLADLLPKPAPEQAAVSAKAPAKKPVTQEIAGLDILELEEAVGALMAGGIYAEAGMGCTGPVILVAPEELERAEDILQKSNYR